MANNKWMDDPVLSGISQEKLNVLTKIIDGVGEKSPKELISYFIKTTGEAANDGIYFNDDETELILNVLKENMSKEEIKRIDSVRKLAKMMTKKYKK